MNTLYIYWLTETKPTAQQVKIYLEELGINVLSVRKRALKHWSKNTCWKVETTDTLEGFNGVRGSLVKSIWVRDVGDMSFTSHNDATLSDVFKHDQ